MEYIYIYIYTLYSSDDLSINIDGPSKAEITKKDIGSGATEYKFLPMSPGEYLVNIKAKGKHIHGSPFSCKVSGRYVLYLDVTHPNPVSSSPTPPHTHYIQNL